MIYPRFSGIGPANRTRHVFRTTDNGTSWNDISGTDGGNSALNLPDLPVHSVVIDASASPHRIIVGSDAGVALTENLGATWQVLGLGLPTVDAHRLALDSTAIPPLLRVGTYGRSTFELAYNRLFVDFRNTGGPNDGTQEHPYLRVTDALSAFRPFSGMKVISIQAGVYGETPPSVTQAVSLNALNGAVDIR